MPNLKEILDKAVLKALIDLGPDIKKLSCFYPNWKNWTRSK